MLYIFGWLWNCGRLTMSNFQGVVVLFAVDRYSNRATEDICTHSWDSSSSSSWANCAARNSVKKELNQQTISVTQSRFILRDSNYKITFGKLQMSVAPVRPSHHSLQCIEKVFPLCVSVSSKRKERNETQSLVLPGGFAAVVAPSFRWRGGGSGGGGGDRRYDYFWFHDCRRLIPLLAFNPLRVAVLSQSPHYHRTGFYRSNSRSSSGNILLRFVFISRPRVTSNRVGERDGECRLQLRRSIAGVINTY